MKVISTADLENTYVEVADVQKALRDVVASDRPKQPLHVRLVIDHAVRLLGRQVTQTRVMDAQLGKLLLHARDASPGEGGELGSTP